MTTSRSRKESIRHRSRIKRISLALATLWMPLSALALLLQPTLGQILASPAPKFPTEIPFGKDHFTRDNNTTSATSERNLNTSTSLLARNETHANTTTIRIDGVSSDFVISEGEGVFIGDTASPYISIGEGVEEDLDPDELEGSGGEPIPLTPSDYLSDQSYPENTVELEKVGRRDVIDRLKSTLNSIDGSNNLPSTECDRLFLSTPNGPRNGTFESPVILTEIGHTLQCIYLFVPRKHERVEVAINRFHVRGTPPECVHEYLDLYTEVEDTDVSDLIRTPFGGRFCGKIAPRRRISLYGGIALGFYTDKNFTDDTIFSGTYSFINEDRYIVGTPVPRTQCSYTLLAKEKRQGTLISPTYPGVYPLDLSCTYKFVGTPGQRIRLEFRDFDLFYGGGHCPFDEVKIYDGMDTMSPLIGTYCGQQRNLVIYSSEHLLLVTFNTLERTTLAQNRGFNAVFEFSESFVKLDFIGKNAGQHVRGTECDQRILSKRQSSGPVFSPNYPYPYLQKIVCRYFIYGLQDPQNLERVRLSFEKFDVPSNVNSEEDVSHPLQTPKCGDGFLKVYLRGQEVIQAYDKPDNEFCGKEVPHDVVSDGPRLVLVFSSGDIQGSGFKAKYVFETEYRIPGTPAPDGSCRFSYTSGVKMGEFNSPRYPTNYPSNTDCIYTFYPKPGEQVRLVFDHFKVRADNINYTGGAYGALCQEDWLEVTNIMESWEKPVGRFCGFTAPAPIESKEKAKSLRVVLHTNEDAVYSGFKARYIYFTAKSIFGECGQNITEAQSGVLTSPKWPESYEGPHKGEGSNTCNWFLTVRPGSRVMLRFDVFAVEGEPNSRGCPAAAVRIWTDPEEIPVELCGEALTPELTQFISAKNIMRFTFITADKAVGARGFKAVWTEIIDASELDRCPDSYYYCSKSQFCIPDKLRCDGNKNCGLYFETIDGTSTSMDDASDEENCGVDGEVDFVMVGILIGCAIPLCCVLVCVWAQRRKRKRRKQLQLRRPPIHVCDNAGARFAAMDRLDNV